MRVARPFKNIQLFLFNSLRAVLGMGNENGLACYGFDKSSFGCCIEEIKRQVQELGLGLSVRGKGIRVWELGLAEGWGIRVWE